MSEPFRIEEALLQHCLDLAPSLRAEDAAEVLASHGLSPLDALVASLKLSSRAWTVFWNNEPLAMLGLTPIDALAGVASVWLLTSTHVDTVPFSFLRLSKEVTQALLHHWPVLVNAIDARHSRAVAWAKWLGAEVLGPVPMGVAGLLFHPVVLRREPCASRPSLQQS